MTDADRSERKLATVLFADLVGSTAAAGEQDPERTRARLERFYDGMAEEIGAAGGIVEKFAGDAVMAAFGVPEALEDHAERALHAALSMQRKLEAGLALRIGVNTGEVVFGRAREGSSFVSGDAVNVAARLEQNAEAEEILVGVRTVAAVRGAFEFGEARTVAAKGKADGIECRPLLRALTLMRPRGVRGLAPAFVGREEELERLLAAHARSVQQQSPALVTILGQAGVGKTRLVRELWEGLSGAEPEPLRRTGRCLAYGEGITYWPFAEVLKEHLGLKENDPPDEVVRRLGEDAILGLTLGLDVAGDLHPLAARDRLHAAWVSQLSELTAERPLVLLIEDVHWAEQALLDLIERLVRDVRGPLLIVTTARPEFAAAWDARLDTESIWLEPLPAKAAQTLVDTLLVGDLPAEVRALVVECAEGNPFFVEEVIGSLIDAGFLERADGGWHARALPPGFEIPDSVQAVLAARIDLLGEAERTALQAAAVIGRVFWSGPVYELVEGLEPDLRVLESRDLIQQRASSSLEGEVEYVFKHALTREVAYGSLTKARRTRLHAQFGDWIERLGEGRDEHAPLLAHHYAEAVRPEDADIAWADESAEHERLSVKAVRWLRRAADVAISRYEIEDGIHLLQSALPLEADKREQARIWRRVGQAHALNFNGEAFVEAMRRALALTDGQYERAEIYGDLAFQTATRSGMWQRRPALELMDEWTSCAIADARPESPTQVRGMLGRAVWGLAANENELIEEAGALAEQMGDLELRSYAWDARGVAAFRRGDFETAHVWEARRFDLLDELTDPDHVHDMHISFIPTCAAIGRIREARRLAEDNDRLVRNLTPHHRLHGVACLLEVAELAGEWERIRELEPRVGEAVEANRATPCVRNARSLILAAVAAEILGDAQRSRELEAQADEHEAEGYGLTFTGPRARLAIEREDFDALERMLPDLDWFRRQTWFALPAAAARLDALAVIGTEDSIREEGLLQPKGYLEPFMLRSLGIVRGEEGLLADADRKFRAMRLDWHAAQTARLRELRPRS
jgi:class 3 adenylate cyclase